MKFHFSVLCFLALLFSSASPAQQTIAYSWWNPASAAFPVIEGQAWPSEVKDKYDRLPARAEKIVAPELWSESRQSAGLYIKFRTDARKIVVRYAVKGKIQFNHMPATGVSGVDLYGLNQDGKWYWSPGKNSFGDTIQYTFSNLLSKDDIKPFAYEYRVYLPLYNSVSWLEIGVPDGNSFTPMPLRAEKPIVVYGTSIAQGACASKPGLAWTSLLERSLDRPMINLGFSGMGHLDKEMIDLITEIDAKAYVLDCIPNLIDSSDYSPEEVDRRLSAAVKQIRAKRPGTPILLTQHSSGGKDHGVFYAKNNSYDRTNEVEKNAFDKMIAAGEKNLYLLSNNDIGFDLYSTVDGEHPSDIGMQQLAVAYEKMLRRILNEPKGSGITDPVQQSRDNFYYFPTRHQEILNLVKTDAPETVIIGNSIMHMWGGKPLASIVNGDSSWNETIAPLQAINMGFGWDRIENTLWRIYHDELDGFSTKRILLAIGTNNLGLNTDAEIMAGYKALIPAILLRQPTAKVYWSGIFPRTGMEKRVKALNAQIAKLAAVYKVIYVNPGKTLLKPDGKTDESMFSDGLHPNQAGYKKLADYLKPYLD